jgi:hypothetical protein
MRVFLGARQFRDKIVSPLISFVIFVLAITALRSLGLVSRVVEGEPSICPAFHAAQSIPDGRERLAAACISVEGQDFVYAVGGRDPEGKITGTVFYTQGPPQYPMGGWKTKNEFFGGAALFDSVIVATHGWLYILGGDNGARSMDSVYRAQPHPGTGDTTWSLTSPLPVPVYLHTAVSLGNRVYVIGGYEYDPGSSISDPVAEVFSAAVVDGGALSSWILEGTLTGQAANGISAHAAVASEDHQCIYVIGGWLGSYSSGTPHNGVFRACVGGSGRLGPWQQEPDGLPLVPEGADGIYYHSASIVDNRVFVIGGTIYKSGSAESTDSIYVGYIDASGHLGDWIVCAHCLPRNLERHGVAAASNGALYVIGGKDRSLGGISNGVLFTPLLSFEKWGTPSGPVTYGNKISYTLQLTNLGVRDLGSCTMTDTVQASDAAVFEFSNLPVECQVYPYAVSTITCAIPSLKLGETTNLGFQVTISEPAAASRSTPTSLQIPIRVTNKARVCENVSASSWCWYATYLNTDVHIYLPTALKNGP